MTHPAKLINGRVALEIQHPIWEKFFLVSPLVVIGTKNADGGYNLAPKHMAMPFGWDNYFGFMCTPSHQTYQNIQREQAFTVSYPRPDQVVQASLSASPREKDQQKSILSLLPTEAATLVDSVFLKEAYLCLECRLHQIIDGFAQSSLITGHIIAAYLSESALRGMDSDDQDILSSNPLLAYLSPGRFTAIHQSQSFPFPAGFQV